MQRGSNRKLVVSLKSSSVELSVADFSKKPQILFNKKESLLYKDPLHPRDFIEKSLSALKKLIKENINDVTAQLKGSKSCEVILYSPWYLPELISEENKNEKVGLKNFFMDKVKPPKQENYIQLENKITNILLNGYKLSKLKDVESDDIEINIYRSFATKKVIEEIENIIKIQLKQIFDIEFSTSAMLSYESLKSLFVNIDDFIFINIGGEITELGIVESDILTFASSVPVGSHLFSRNLDTFINEKGNLSTLSFLSEKATDQKLDKRKNDKIKEISNFWFKEIIDSLKEKSQELPKKIFLISNSDSIDFFQMISKEYKDFDIIILNNSSLEDKVESNKSVVEYLLSTYYLSIKS